MSNRSRVMRTVRPMGQTVAEVPCNYSNYKCTLRKLDNYNYCIRHILEDKTAPYKQCNYTFPTSGRRCHRASPCSDKKDGFCTRHSRQAFHTRSRSGRQKQPHETAEKLLDKLNHHVIPLTPSQNVIPDPSSVGSRALVALSYASDTESDLDVAQDVTLLPRLEDDSELDSADSDSDPLDHAGIFTADEVSRIYLEKLKKLKSVYTQEYKQLFQILKDARRKYLTDVKIEKDTMCSIHAQPKPNPEERNEYEKLKSLIKYHQHFGAYKSLHHQLMERRRQVTEGNPLTRAASSPQVVKCIFGEGSWKCGEKCIPYSKYCSKHILNDTSQVLFRACGATRGENLEECNIPIIPLPNTPACVYHTELPPPMEISESVEEAEIAMAHESLEKLPPRIIDLNDASNFVVTEVPPDNIMDDDDDDTTTKEEQLNA